MDTDRLGPGQYEVAFPHVDARDHQRAVSLSMPLGEFVRYRDSLRRQHAAIRGPGRLGSQAVRPWMVPGSDQAT